MNVGLLDILFLGSKIMLISALEAKKIVETYDTKTALEHLSKEITRYAQSGLRELLVCDLHETVKVELIAKGFQLLPFKSYWARWSKYKWKIVW